jgi:hypothetical protein
MARARMGRGPQTPAAFRAAAAHPSLLPEPEDFYGWRVVVNGLGSRLAMRELEGMMAGTRSGAGGL